MRTLTAELPKPAELTHVDHLKTSQRCCQLFSLLLDDILFVFTQRLGDLYLLFAFLFPSVFTKYFI